MMPRETPVPPAIAALPHDPRGYPIPAITPRDAEGHPTFAITGAARTLICAIERRCSICGTPMAPGPVYRVIAAAETEALTAAHNGGQTATNKAPSRRGTVPACSSPPSPAPSWPAPTRAGARTRT